MSDPLEYIEAYFEKELDEAGRQEFEQRCEQDSDFARDVALYITTREAMRLSLAEQKRAEWRLLDDENRTRLSAVPHHTEEEKGVQLEERRQTTSQAPVRKMAIRRWAPYAVAACLLVFVFVYYTGGDRELRNQIASNVAQALQAPSPTMGTASDLEKAKTAYQKGDDEQARKLFRSILQADSMHDDALLYIGCTFWRQKNYDSALHYFDKLSSLDLSSNQGPFDGALVLLQRNKPGDREKAKVRLQKVVDEKLDGSEKAQELLDLMK